jgi:DNA-binding transcriptional MerR regulator
METQGEFFEVPREIVTDAEARADAEPIANLSAGSARRGMKDLSIPKLYYSISEVSRLTGLEQYVLRYWETEFDELSPQKNRAGNRIYSNKDITFILHIKDLLREKRYTIEGAKQILKDERLAPPSDRKELVETETTEPNRPELQGLRFERQELDEIRGAAMALKELFGKKKAA